MKKRATCASTPRERRVAAPASVNATDRVSTTTENATVRVSSTSARQHDHVREHPPRETRRRACHWENATDRVSKRKPRQHDQESATFHVSTHLLKSNWLYTSCRRASRARAPRARDALPRPPLGKRNGPGQHEHENATVRVSTNTRTQRSGSAETRERNGRGPRARAPPARDASPRPPLGRRNGPRQYEHENATVRVSTNTRTQRKRATCASTSRERRVAAPAAVNATDRVSNTAENATDRVSTNAAHRSTQRSASATRNRDVPRQHDHVHEHPARETRRRARRCVQEGAKVRVNDTIQRNGRGQQHDLAHTIHGAGFRGEGFDSTNPPNRSYEC